MILKLKRFNEILNFITKRFSNDSEWLNGNCYWFAHILSHRFPELIIYYLPIEGHFVAGTTNKEGERQFFDWNGAKLESEINDEILNWDAYRYIDPIHWNRITKYCIN